MIAARPSRPNRNGIHAIPHMTAILTTPRSNLLIVIFSNRVGLRNSTEQVRAPERSADHVGLLIAL